MSKRVTIQDDEVVVKEDDLYQAMQACIGMSGHLEEVSRGAIPLATKSVFEEGSRVWQEYADKFEAILEANGCEPA